MPFCCYSFCRGYKLNDINGSNILCAGVLDVTHRPCTNIITLDTDLGCMFDGNQLRAVVGFHAVSYCSGNRMELVVYGIAMKKGDALLCVIYSVLLIYLWKVSEVDSKHALKLSDVMCMFGG